MSSRAARRERAASPDLYFRDGRLSVPGYTFPDPARSWGDPGTSRLFVEGEKKHGAEGIKVLAKISPRTALSLERETHMLGSLANSIEAAQRTMRIMECLMLPPAAGNVTVLILKHPGPNALARFFPVRPNTFLVPETAQTLEATPAQTRSPTPAPLSDESGEEQAEITPATEVEGFSYVDEEEGDIIDIAAFLDFAQQATHCLEVVHSLNMVHGEIRPNTWHWNAHTDHVRFAHFGQKTISLDSYSGISSVVLATEQLEESERQRVKETLCFVSPEQLGARRFGGAADHRTDLYGLGVVFWVVLTRQSPYEGGVLEIFQAIQNRDPPMVHEIRPDVPRVLSVIIQKLMQKDPAKRYRSAAGLKEDLLECQRLLTLASASSEETTELIPEFPIAQRVDLNSTFVIPSTLFGREEELGVVRGVLRQVANAHVGKGPRVIQASTTSGSTRKTQSESVSGDSLTRSVMPLATESKLSSYPASGGAQPSPILEQARSDSGSSIRSDASSAGAGPAEGPAVIQVPGPPVKKQRKGVRAVVISGPGGIGKSALLSEVRSEAIELGLVGSAKFDRGDLTPYSAVLACLSSIFRHFLTEPESVIHDFFSSLKASLGPQVENIRLLYTAVPELQTLVAIAGSESLLESVPSTESRVRFHTITLEVIAALARLRMITINLEDIHLADASSLKLIEALSRSRIRLLLLCTVRSEHNATCDRLRAMFNSRATWIALNPLKPHVIASLVSATLHRPVDECMELAQVLDRHVHGNPLTTRSLLGEFSKHQFIHFDWTEDSWRYNLSAIEKFFESRSHLEGAESDPTFLIHRLRELPPEVQRFLSFASFFGNWFDIRTVAALMDEDVETDESGSEEGSSSTEADKRKRNLSQKWSVGLQVALGEGFVTSSGRDQARFSHDLTRQACVELAHDQPEGFESIRLKIATLLIQRPNFDRYRVSEHLLRCKPALRNLPMASRMPYVRCLYEAGTSSFGQGALESALSYFSGAFDLLVDDPEASAFEHHNDLMLKLAELYQRNEDNARSEITLDAVQDPTTIETTVAQQIRARNHFFRGEQHRGMQALLTSLEALGVHIGSDVTSDETRELFNTVRRHILDHGVDEVMRLPRATEHRATALSSLLSEAFAMAFYLSPSLAGYMGLKNVQVALEEGISPASATGFIVLAGFALSAGDYEFGFEIARLGLALADKFGSHSEKGRARVLYISGISPAQASHFREAGHMATTAIGFAQAAGDRQFEAWAISFKINVMLQTGRHLEEVINAAEEVLSDLSHWHAGNDTLAFLMTTRNCARALAGRTAATSPGDIFDSEEHNEEEYLQNLRNTSMNIDVSLNMYFSHKVCALFCLGFHEAAAELGFEAERGQSHFSVTSGNHRHSQVLTAYHAFALVACLRRGVSDASVRSRYERALEVKRGQLADWHRTARINVAQWHHLVSAEVLSLREDPGAAKEYDLALRAAQEGHWILEEGWSHYLTGRHFSRTGMETLGRSMQQQSLGVFGHFGATGIVSYLLGLLQVSATSDAPLSTYTAEVGVQTDSTPPVNMPALHRSKSIASSAQDASAALHAKESVDEAVGHLSAADLAAIIKSFQAISSDVNLSSSLERLTEIIAETSGAEHACIIIRGEASTTFDIMTRLTVPDSCIVYEKPRPLSEEDSSDVIAVPVIRHVIRSREAIVLSNAAEDPRFGPSVAALSPGGRVKSIVALPVKSKGTILGVIYIVSGITNAFADGLISVLGLLATQAAISITNGTLFRSLRRATQSNLRAISEQRTALEAARRSREEALRLSSVKSSFLASMSHELRTPFASFYGLLGLLAETKLDPEQREFVQTARQSCEALLDTISALLDFSKLEHGGVQLEVAPFPPGNLIAECEDLLLSLASEKGLDLAWTIEADVPDMVEGDAFRIRQILQNLLGNALKFTLKGAVTACCSLDHSGEIRTGADQVVLKIEVEDTGVGISRKEMKLLFQPFSQVDSSTTKRFGGTGLGLSICLQLCKLMGGDINVSSNPGKGSKFTFRIPVRVPSEVPRPIDLEEADRLRRNLLSKPLRILAYSPSPVTTSLLKTTLDGLPAEFVSKLEEFDKRLASFSDSAEPTVNGNVSPPDFVILDLQSESEVDRVRRIVEATPKLSRTTIINLLAPTTEMLKRRPSVSDASSRRASDSVGRTRISRINKPLRRVRLLRALASVCGVEELNGLATPSPSTRQMYTADHFTPEEQEYLRTCHILIAEDNPVAQKLLIKQLQRLDFKVEAASNGDEAIKLWEQHEPGFFRVAMFDHHMPVCDGLLATRKLRARERKRHTATTLPIVALTADCQASTMANCMDAGMQGYFTKPLKQGDLVELIRRFVLRREDGVTPTERSPSSTFVAPDMADGDVSNAVHESDKAASAPLRDIVPQTSGMKNRVLVHSHSSA